MNCIFKLHKAFHLSYYSKRKTSKRHPALELQNQCLNCISLRLVEIDISSIYYRRLLLFISKGNSPYLIISQETVHLLAVLDKP